MGVQGDGGAYSTHSTTGGDAGIYTAIARTLCHCVIDHARRARVVLVEASDVKRRAKDRRSVDDVLVATRESEC